MFVSDTIYNRGVAIAPAAFFSKFGGFDEYHQSTCSSAKMNSKFYDVFE